MKIQVGSRHAAIAAAVAAVVSLTSAAQAIQSTAFTYSTPKAGTYSISPFAMAPSGRSSTVGGSWGISYDPTYLTGTGAACYNTGVNLPEGARITKLTVWYSSNSSSDVSVLLNRTNFLDGSSDALVRKYIPDDTATRKANLTAVVASLAFVANATYAYGFAVCPGTDGRFYGATITYSYQNAGD